MNVDNLTTEQAKELEKYLSSRAYRLNNLYYIQDKRGRKVKFKLNEPQTIAFNEMWYLNVILKGRQQGMSTFIEILMLDMCLFRDDTSCGLVAHTLDDAKGLLASKVKYPYDNLPDWLKEAVPLTTDSKTELAWGNNSKLRVGTSLRGGTYNILHVSEYGKIAHKYPDKAEEIVAGAFNTIQAGQQIFVESTHEGGKGGRFYELCVNSMGKKDEELTKLDFKFLFFPWFNLPEYRLKSDHTIVDEETTRYLDTIEKYHGITLDKEQRIWYFKKKIQQGFKIYQEFPSTVEEAFMVEVSGAFYAKQMGRARAEKRITRVPHDPSVPVYTFWDLGLDMTSVWFVQFIGREISVINYYENDDEDIHHFIAYLDQYQRRTNCRWGKHMLPHDGKRRSVVDTKNTVLSIFQDQGLPVDRVVSDYSLMSEIEQVRQTLPKCVFDENECERGITVLESYHQKWNESMNCWTGEPVHDWASHGATAFMVMVIALRQGRISDNSMVSAMEAEPSRAGFNGRIHTQAIDDDWDPLYDR